MHVSVLSTHKSGNYWVSSKELGLEKNTIIVIWGDNGFHLGEQHLWGKSTNFELDCKVPLLIYSPEYKDAPKRINDIVELIDIYPTLTDFCGLKPAHTLSGQSLRFLIENKLTGRIVLSANSQGPIKR